MARTSMTLQLLATTGGIALLLGVVGIYGTVAYAVTQRRREIGIRLALGAPTGEIRRIFVAHALTIAGAGTIVGLLAAAVLTRLMRSQLFGVGPMDPVTHASVLAGLLGAAALASAAAARRASRVDPAEVLKSE